MRRRDKDKASLVDFLGSIKFGRRKAEHGAAVSSHFAHLDPQARPAHAANAEDYLLVRSAN